MSDGRLVVAVDSCVIIEAVHLRSRDSAHPSVRLFDYIIVKALVLFLIENVAVEARLVRRFAWRQTL